MLREVRERNERIDRGEAQTSSSSITLELHQLDRRYEALRISDPKFESHLCASLAEQGQRTPVLVTRSVLDATRCVLIDGYRRARALERISRDTIDAIVLPMDDPAALVFAHKLASGRRECPLEQAWLVRELHEAHQRPLAVLAVEFGRTASWLSRRMALCTALPDTVQEHVRSGAIGVHVAMKYLVPLARANDGDCTRLADAVARATLTSRQVAVLYIAWRSGDRDQREKIVADPLLFLRAYDAVSHPVAVTEPTPQRVLIDRLESIAGLCWRARRTAREALAADARTLMFEDVRAAWHSVHAAYGALAKGMHEAGHVGP
jgi:ParB/RepB/Spo0J family partition protein